MLKGQWHAARALLGWTQADLAARVGVSSMTIKRLENDQPGASVDVMRRAKAALEAAGVEFVGGAKPGVRMPRDRTRGFLHDDKRLVGRIKNGELRSDPGNELAAVVNEGSLHDPQTGERLYGLAPLELKGQPLPPALKARLK